MAKSLQIKSIKRDEIKENIATYAIIMSTFFIPALLLYLLLTREYSEIIVETIAAILSVFGCFPVLIIFAFFADMFDKLKKNKKMKSQPKIEIETIEENTRKSPQEKYYKIIRNANSTETIRICSLCEQEIGEQQIFAQCPVCEAIYHRKHLDEWLEKKGKCPSCSIQMKKKIIIEELTFVRVTKKQWYHRILKSRSIEK